MLKNLPVNNIDWIKDISQFNEDFIKNYNEKSDEKYFLEVYVLYLKNLHEFHNEWSLLPVRVAKLVTDLHDKFEDVIHIRNWKQAFNHGLVSKKGS